MALAHSWPKYVRLDNVDLYERMIVEGAWWDFVDEIATHLTGVLLLNHRAEMNQVLDVWINDGNLWLRRAAILSHERHKTATDAERLFRYCEQRLGDREFFIRKAIGWALRSYSKTDPTAVRAFCDAHRRNMSGLTWREATKYL